MGNLSKKQILKEIDDAMADAVKFQKDIAVQVALIKDADLLKLSAENKLFAAKLRAVKFRELLIIERGFSSEIIKLRGAITVCLKRVGRKDITIAEKEMLELEIKKLQEQLKALCQHDFVLSYDGYSGSQYNDWDDARFGHRWCIVCDFSERSESTKKDIYKVLFESDIRLVKRDLRRLSGKDYVVNKNEIWENLDGLLELFEDAAGRPYLELKKIKTKTP